MEFDLKGWSTKCRSNAKEILLLRHVIEKAILELAKPYLRNTPY